VLVEPSAWEAYWQIIQEFAHAAAQVLPVGGDLIWVHGYQLMLVFASCYAGRAGIQSSGSRWSRHPRSEKLDESGLKLYSTFRTETPVISGTPSWRNLFAVAGSRSRLTLLGGQIREQ